MSGAEERREGKSQAGWCMHGVTFSGSISIKNKDKGAGRGLEKTGMKRLILEIGQNNRNKMQGG